MKHTLVLIVALVGLSANAAFAQDAILLPEEEVVVREYIVRQPHHEVVVPDDYEIVIGEPPPDTVIVSPLDAPGFSKQFEYVVIAGRTVLVDPDTGDVVTVLD